MENQIKGILQDLQDSGKYIALSLHPPIGSPMIEKEGNRMFINEGRDGKFEGVSEAFYDKMVQEFDSRTPREEDEDDDDDEEELICPECGSYDIINEGYNYDDAQSYCSCNDCDHYGNKADFQPDEDDEEYAILEVMREEEEEKARKKIEDQQ